MEIAVSGPEPAPEVVARLLRGLPEWFGIESSVEAYIEAARRLPTLIATDDQSRAVGALVYERHFPETTEVYLLAVERAMHRQGVGRALVDRLAASERERDVQLLSVKTLGPSHPDRGYAATRAFYRASGFHPVEELDGVWPENPCLILVKPLVPPR